MKYYKLFFILVFFVFFQTNTKGQFNVTGSNGADNSYTSLTNAGGVFANHKKGQEVRIF